MVHHRLADSVEFKKSRRGVYGYIIDFNYDNSNESTMARIVRGCAMITSKTHTLNVISERDGYALCEITRDDASEQSICRFYVVQVDNAKNQVYSVDADGPKGGGSWFGGYDAYGVAYVGSARIEATARRLYRKCRAEARSYGC